MIKRLVVLIQPTRNAVVALFDVLLICCLCKVDVTVHNFKTCSGL